jgi:hypothetical protein
MGREVNVAQRLPVTSCATFVPAHILLQYDFGDAQTQSSAIFLKISTKKDHTVCEDCLDVMSVKVHGDHFKKDGTVKNEESDYRPRSG